MMPPLPRFTRAAVLQTGALTLIALMASVPFLNPHHRNPLSTFFPEWWAALFGLLATLVLLDSRYRKDFSLPKAALIPAALAALILLQLGWLPATRADTSLLAVLYLLWAILLMGLANSLIQHHGARSLANALAIGIAVGALASALLVVLQGTDTLRGTGWVSTLVGNRLFANLNQPNHLALQLWLGVVALMHLASQRQLRTSIALIAIACLVVASLFTGSRAVLPYALALPVLALWQRQKNGSAPMMLPLALAALMIALAAQFALPWLMERSTLATVGERDWSSKGGDSLRTGLWWMALQMGSDNLLTGIGWGRFASHTFEQIIALRSVAPVAMQIVPAEHAHNIGLHLFAELGLLGPLVFFGLVGAWVIRVWRAARNRWSAEMSFAIGLLLLLGLHAQLEYTLWYTFFLGIAAVALALSDPGRISLPPPKLSLTALVLATALATLLLLRSDYERLENTMQWPLTVDGQPPRPWAEVSAELLELRGRSRFGAYVDLSLAGAMKLEREGLADKLVVCNKAIAFSPTHYAVFKCASLLALDGQAAVAQDRMQRALLAYPEKAEDFARSGANLLMDFPELEPLIAEAKKVTERRAPVQATPTAPR